jgi:8-oxo-dGTP pyrophosphatase MutT (NUDIX family)
MPKARVEIGQKTPQAATTQSVNRNAARSKASAGILAYRRTKHGLEVLLVHPGGPFWRNKDEGAWSIPKGEIDAIEDPEQAARREFAEELGATPLSERWTPWVRSASAVASA